jgi:hypothetical protein
MSGTPFEHERYGGRREQRRGEVAALERDLVGVERVEARAGAEEGRMLAGIVEDRALEETREMPAPEGVGHRRRAEAERRAERRSRA